MSNNLKPDEREVLKLVNFFRKHAGKLNAENKLEAEYLQFMETCNKFAEQLNFHAVNRELVIKEREQLKSMIKDNAQCPKCAKNAHLKYIGTDKNEQGWESNKYKCRRCNIEFVWNAPNNPFDMIPYVENFIANLEKKLQSENPGEEVQQHTTGALEQMKANLGKLKPVVEGSNKDLAELEEREKEMSAIVAKFKKLLKIEKIKIED